MEPIKLFDSEWKVMEILWEKEPVSAREISLTAAERIGWNKNTTYTIIKKLIDKNYIRRTEPHFICTSQIKREDVQMAETKNLIDKLYRGSKKAFFASFLSDGNLSAEEIEEIRRMIEKR